MINAQNKTDHCLTGIYSEKLSDFAVKKLVNDCEAVEKKVKENKKYCLRKAVQATYEISYKKRCKDIYIYS